ncbi:CDP-glycerol glycerophosphotransferase family protein [Brevibacterium rongguiense]|uniref:CDP-glycerol glycerophosphotransferase family protein n=1 Tax=Brevibacterium rongguiense TaxID=2695267 RepID=UPI002E2DF504|nr:CDP-glycerol glycerophosphotransferase family protein [Brevibacterium rongguiense]
MAGLLRNTIRRALSSPAWKRTSRWIRGIPDYTHLEAQYEKESIDAEVIAYFGDARAKTYQLIQWLPVLEELAKHHRVAIVLRRPSAIAAVSEHTNLPIVYQRRFLDFMNMLFRSHCRLAIYVNNGMTNFQALGYAPMVHVHVNHGESDKISMVSNQAKAYDRVFVAGQAAVERHRRALLDFDESKLMRIGRPQLDIPAPNVLPRTVLTTVMYAPTWEGENDANNYTSVDAYGPQIVRAVLGLGGVRLVYKPHPRVENSADPVIAKANAEILALIEAAGGEHCVQMQGNILGMFEAVDLMITDVSSVGLDFLYMRPEKPLLLTDRRNDPETLHTEAPITRATPVLSEANADDIRGLITTMLHEDQEAGTRAKMRTHYFGAGAVGSSLEAFVGAVTTLLREREDELRGHTETRDSGAVEAG